MIKLLSLIFIKYISNNLQTYDEELAFGAQKWAEQCVRGHDCDECRTLPRGYRVGQVRKVDLQRPDKEEGPAS